jgi:Ca-activated chloride channel family protein
MATFKTFYRGAILLLLAASCNTTESKNGDAAVSLQREVSAAADSASALPEQFNTEDYDNIVENNFTPAKETPLSTFSIDVDDAAYSNVRRFIESGTTPPKGAVRIEEMINYFDYNYAAPQNDDAFAIHTEISSCPWNQQHRLVHIGIKGKEIATNHLPPANLVFLIDVSGSMDEANKLPLVQSSLKLLTQKLRADDKVAIVVYAGAAGLVLPSTTGSDKEKITSAINNLHAGGSTAGAEGIQLAYKIATENFIEDGNNRVILATDGDFNVGASSDDELVTLIENKRKSGVFLTVLGYGMDNYKDNKMQQLADKGNGNHAYIDNLNEAKKILVNEFGSTLFTIAKDVKLQVEFNPAKTGAYRLIGYENRMLQKEDFNNDKKDAGEVGAGHTVTAMYEVIPVGVKDEFTTTVDKLKYQQTNTTIVDGGNEIITIKLRYKKPDSEVSNLIVKPVQDEQTLIANTSDNFRFSASVAAFGMLLRNSVYKQQADYDEVFELAKNALGADANGYRTEFIGLVKKAAALSIVKN